MKKLEKGLNASAQYSKTDGHNQDENHNNKLWIVYAISVLIIIIVLSFIIKNIDLLLSLIILVIGTLIVIIGRMLKVVCRNRVFDMNRLYKLDGTETAGHTFNAIGMSYVDTGVKLSFDQIKDMQYNPTHLHRLMKATIQYQFYVLFGLPIKLKDCHLVFVPSGTNDMCTIFSKCETDKDELLSIILRSWGLVVIMIASCMVLAAMHSSWGLAIIAAAIVCICFSEKLV